MPPMANNAIITSNSAKIANRELGLLCVVLAELLLADFFSTKLLSAGRLSVVGSCCKLSVTTISLMNDPIYFLLNTFFDPTFHGHQHINILRTRRNLYFTKA